MKWYNAYEYDFNSGHGEVVIHETSRDTVQIGEEILLVCTDGDDGFGTIVTVTEILPAANKNYLRVRTDLRARAVAE